MVHAEVVTLKWSMRNTIAVIVVCVWAITSLTSIVTNNFTSLGAVTPVMMIVAGFLFGSRDRNGRNGNGGNKK